MTILNYILHITFVGVQKTSTNNPFPSTNPLGGRGFSAFTYASTQHSLACKDKFIWIFLYTFTRTQL